MKKKAQVIDQLYPLIIGLVVITIVLTVGFLIFSEAKDVVESKIPGATATNESVNYAYDTLTDLEYSPTALSLSCSSLYVGNQSGDKRLVGTGNYTCTTAGITITNGSMDALFPYWNVTYSYTLGNIAYNATGEVQNATQDIPTWLPIIVITIIGSLLIGLVSFFRNS